MNYQQTIEYLYQHLPMFSRIGAAAYKKDLHNTIALCDALDKPQTNSKVFILPALTVKEVPAICLPLCCNRRATKQGYTLRRI